MATKRFRELKGLSKDELLSKMRDVELQLFQTKMKHVTKQLADTALIWRLRKEMARMKTIQGQMLLAEFKQDIEKAAR